MNDRFREISDRLRSIEASLSRVQLSPNGSHSHYHTHGGESSPGSMPSLHHSAASPDSTSSGQDEPTNLANAITTQHALQTISDTLGLMEAMDKESKDRTEVNETGGGEASGLGANGFAQGAQPQKDAISRGLLSVPECEASFKIFFRLLAPWVMFFDPQRDGDAVEMRVRSPLLFHVILLSTSYYLMGTSERGTAIYLALVDLVNDLIAPILISTQGYHLNTDLVRALNLLMLYKPVQFASLAASGVTDRAQAEQLSKLNGFTSATLYSVTHRVAFVTQLNDAPKNFTKVFSPGTPPPPGVLADLRLWLFLCVVDGHGSLVAGRALSVDITEALRVTRMLAALKAQPADVRLAASVELYGIARTIISTPWFRACGSAPVSAYELRKFNREMDEWETYWRPELLHAAEVGDIFAMTVIDTFSSLVRLIVNASVFTRWRYERKLSLSRGGEGRPKLSPEDWSFLQLVLNATEHLLFALSVESRINGSAMNRAVQWPKVPPGERRQKLTVDQAIVDTHRTAVDPISTISYIYPCILVAKMANAGLCRCELETCQATYESGESSNWPSRLINGAKLPRLLELGADFLAAFAPTPTHPAHKHARMLRTILAAGTLGQVKSSEFSDADLPQLSPSDVSGPPPPSAAGSAPDAPSLPNLQPPAGRAFNALPPPQRMSSYGGSPEAGLALASILGGIQPAYFGGPESETQGIMFEDLGGSLSAMDIEVDWDGLEKSMRAAEEQAGGGHSGFTEADWQSYFGQQLSSTGPM